MRSHALLALLCSQWATLRFSLAEAQANIVDHSSSLHPMYLSIASVESRGSWETVIFNSKSASSSILA